MKPFFRTALLAVCLVVGYGCSSSEQPAPIANASGTLTPGQEAGAKNLGIATANQVKENPGMYTGDVNLAKSAVEGQQKRIDAENAAVKAMTPNAH